MYEALSTLPLGHSSLIRTGNKPAFYRDCYLKGIRRIKHLHGNSTDLLSWIDFHNKYNLKVQPSTFHGIISAINRLGKNKDLPKHDGSFKKLLEYKAN